MNDTWGRTAGSPTWTQTLGRDLLLVVGIGALLWLSLSTVVAGEAALAIAGGPGASIGFGDVMAVWVGMANEPGTPLAEVPGGATVGPGVWWPIWAAVTFVPVLVVGWLMLRRLRTVANRNRGWAKPATVKMLMGERSLMKRAGSLRPTTSVTEPEQVGVRLGTAISGGGECWASIEDSVLVLAPPRMGKTTQIVIPVLLGWRGPALVTSTKVDVLASTFGERRSGPVWVIDPSGVTDWPNAVGWDVTSGCHDVRVAQNRAAAMVSAAGAGDGVQNGSYWTEQGSALLACWLIAAAHPGGNLRDVLRWSQAEGGEEAADVLAASGLPELAREARRFATMDPEPRSSVWSMASLPLRALLQPAVAAAFAPADNARLDLDQWFESGNGTIYLVADEKGDSAVRGLMTALVDAVATRAKRRAQRAPGGRLDPPVAVLLDEAANIAPLKDIPDLMSVAGSQSMFLMVVLQANSQGEQVWGPAGIRKLVSSATVRLLLGGGGDPDDLERWSKLIGERDEQTVSVHVGGEGPLSTQGQIRRRSILEVAELRAIPEREALLLFRTIPPVMLRQVRSYEGDDAKKLRESEEWFRSIVSQG
jgi:type IV secretory pathway TraG/TraD family ATPase VirD4